MIKLINYYTNREKGQIVFINKSCIGGMVRDEQEGLTRVWDNGVAECAYYDFKETPEEILAMPDIEEANKVIDWEQRRYEIAMHYAAHNFMFESPNPTAVQAIEFADALIEKLKGVEK